MAFTETEIAEHSATLENGSGRTTNGTGIRRARKPPRCAPPCTQSARTPTAASSAEASRPRSREASESALSMELGVFMIAGEIGEHLPGSGKHMQTGFRSPEICPQPQAPWRAGTALASRRDAGCWGTLSGGVASLNHRLQAGHPAGMPVQKTPPRGVGTATKGRPANLRDDEEMFSCKELAWSPHQNLTAAAASKAPAWYYCNTTKVSTQTGACR